MSSPFVVLMYHRVVESPSSVYDVTPVQLESHITHLIDHGYAGGDMAALNRPVLDAIPAKRIFLTFDDGHRSGLLAAEIAQKFGIKAAFYLSKNICLERDDYLSPDEIRDLAHMGVIGAHGVTHSPLIYVPQDQLGAELHDSRAWLEDIVGGTVDTMSYPGGAYNRQVLNATRAAGYTLIGTSREWWNAPTHVAASRMFNRVAIKVNATNETVLNLMDMQLRAYARRRFYYELTWNSRQVLSPQLVAKIRRS